MHEQQLQELRREKWRLNGRPIRTLDEAREFIDSVGFCLLYPQRPAVLLPTFIGAYTGSDENLPDRADGLCRSQRARSEGADGPPAAREGGLRGERFPRKQLHRLGLGVSVFLRTGGRPQPAPGAEGRRTLGVFSAGGAAFSIIQKEGPISEAPPARVAGRRHLRGGAGSRAG